MQTRRDLIKVAAGCVGGLAIPAIASGKVSTPSTVAVPTLPSSATSQCLPMSNIRIGSTITSLCGVPLIGKLVVEAYPELIGHMTFTISNFVLTADEAELLQSRFTWRACDFNNPWSTLTVHERPGRVYRLDGMYLNWTSFAKHVLDRKFYEGMRFGYAGIHEVAVPITEPTIV